MVWLALWLFGMTLIEDHCSLLKNEAVYFFWSDFNLQLMITVDITVCSLLNEYLFTVLLPVATLNGESNQIEVDMNSKIPLPTNCCPVSTTFAVFDQ